MRWLAPGADAARILTRRPAECLGKVAVPQTEYSIELGRAAFRSPLLLGGQAARAGVACETCHRNGATNPDFDFPGLSGAPGTADVTSSLFSSHRGDGVDNPRPIPNLSGPKAALKVSQDRASAALPTFIQGLVTQEFDGAEPPPAVLQGLADYVRALSPAACPRPATEAVTATGTVHDARRAVRAALAALDHKDAPAAAVMIEAARAQLGLIDERYAAPALAQDRAAVQVASLDLAGALAAVRSGDSAGSSQHLTAWLAESVRWQATLQRDESRSLYDRAVLAKAARRLPAA
jgi:hypothetical protein